MDAVKIYENAVRKLNKSEITIGEFENIIEPLRNVEQASTIKGNTLIVPISKENFEKIKRVMLDCVLLCGIFYEDVSNEARWIPVKEKLPDKDGTYLVTDDSGGAKWVESSMFIQCDDGSVYWDFANVTAWMPLPEPYKEGERE